MSVDEDRRGLRVINVFDGSPAKTGGIKKGDFITEVDGRSIAGVSSDVATARIKGPAGHEGRASRSWTPTRGTPRYLTLKRERIEVPVAESKIVERNGKKLRRRRAHHLQPGRARAAAPGDRQGARAAARRASCSTCAATAAGCSRRRCWCRRSSSRTGLITFTKGRTKPRREFEAEGGAIPKDIPVVVLVDRGSASASEIVTGALRDTKRATVVGTRTFGKGVFQEVLPLSNGGVLDITVGEYFLPSGENIGKKGVQPYGARGRRSRDRPRRGAADRAEDAGRRAMSDGRRAPARWTSRWSACCASAAASWWPRRCSSARGKRSTLDGRGGSEGDIVLVGTGKRGAAGGPAASAGPRWRATWSRR